MDFVQLDLDKAFQSRYISLFRTCFPSAKHFTSEYLEWLYLKNPDGQVIGFNALDGQNLAAHYACLPIRLFIYGKSKPALLSLNTATHPNYQGKGLFTKLANLTYQLAASCGYECVIGVANANSTPGFIRKLGFQLIAPLEARLGFGSLNIDDWPKLLSITVLRRAWDQTSISWRRSNPSNILKSWAVKDGLTFFWASTDKPGIKAWAEIPINLINSTQQKLFSLAPRVFLGLIPSGFARYRYYSRIPEAVKPSPLNLIYLDIQKGSHINEAKQILISFLDFDAY